MELKHVVTAAAKESPSVPGKITIGDLPPNSMLIRFIVANARWDTPTPADVEPVKEIMDTNG